MILPQNKKTAVDCNESIVSDAFPLSLHETVLPQLHTKEGGGKERFSYSANRFILKQGANGSGHEHVLSTDTAARTITKPIPIVTIKRGV